MLYKIYVKKVKLNELRKSIPIQMINKHRCKGYGYENIITTTEKSGQYLLHSAEQLLQIVSVECFYLHFICVVIS